MKCQEIAFERGRLITNLRCDQCKDHPESVVIKWFYHSHDINGIFYPEIVASLIVIRCHGSRFVVDDQADVQTIRKTLFVPAA